MGNGRRRRGVGEIVIGAGPERLVEHDSKFTKGAASMLACVGRVRWQTALSGSISSGGNVGYHQSSRLCVRD